MFDEAKGWNWSHNHSEESQEFSITLGEFGNHGIQKEEEHIETEHAFEEQPEELDDEVDSNDGDT